MRPVVLFIAMSIDGHIARPNGDIDWLFTDQDYGYDNFLNRIDTVVMGNRTYEVICSFGDYPFQGKQTVVFSHTRQGADENGALFTQKEPSLWLEEERQKSGKAIWLVGGPKLLRQFWQHDLVDEMIISLHPNVLGEGVPLFDPPVAAREWQLGEVFPYKTGLVQIHYLRKVTDLPEQQAPLQ